MSRKPRTYQPIWEQLKAKHICKLEVQNKNLIARIKKAIYKEKDMDIIWKIENEERTKMKLQITVQEDVKTKKIFLICKLEKGLTAEEV